MRRRDCRSRKREGTVALGARLITLQVPQVILLDVVIVSGKSAFGEIRCKVFRGNSGSRCQYWLCSNATTMRPGPGKPPKLFLCLARGRRNSLSGPPWAHGVAQLAVGIVPCDAACSQSVGSFGGIKNSHGRCRWLLQGGAVSPLIYCSLFYHRRAGAGLDRLARRLWHGGRR